MAQLANHPGFYLNDAAAADFDRYERDHGVFQLNDAKREVWEQQDLINRWYAGGWQNRPPYLYQPFEPAELGPHVKDGGKAVDIGDWGRFQQHMGDYNFSKPYDWDVVHFEHTGAGGGGGASIYDQWGGKPWIIAIQEKLIRLGYDLGSWGADGDPGDLTQNAIADVQTKNGLEVDRVAGPQTNAVLDRLLTPSQAWPVFPLPAGKWFGPEAGGENTVSGYHHPSGNGDPGLRQWQQQMKDRGWEIIVDGLYGNRGDTTPRGNTADVAGAFQLEKGLVFDKEIGPQTWDAAWTAPVTPGPDGPSEPTPEVPAVPAPVEPSEAAATPDLVTPTAADFPLWIRFNSVFDPEALKPDLNAKAEVYYQKPYFPIESHTHWWGEPNNAGTHDGNVELLRSKDDLGAQFVTSAGRVTLMIPLNKIALTTGQRNPFAWKTENDPALTELGYKTLAYVHYIVEKLNPRLKDEPIRLHKEFYATQCSMIDVAKVRLYANQFASGVRDTATGELTVVTTPPPPVPDPLPDPTPDPTPEPEPTPDPEPTKVLVNKASLEEILDWFNKEFDEPDRIRDWLKTVLGL